MLTNFSNCIEQEYVWIDETLLEAKKTLAEQDMWLLPRTPSQKKKYLDVMRKKSNYSQYCTCVNGVKSSLSIPVAALDSHFVHNSDRCLKHWESSADGLARENGLVKTNCELFTDAQNRKVCASPNCKLTADSKYMEVAGSNTTDQAEHVTPKVLVLGETVLGELGSNGLTTVNSCRTDRNGMGSGHGEVGIQEQSTKHIFNCICDNTCKECSLLIYRKTGATTDSTKETYDPKDSRKSLVVCEASLQKLLQNGESVPQRVDKKLDSSRDVNGCEQFQCENIPEDDQAMQFYKTFNSTDSIVDITNEQSRRCSGETNVGHASIIVLVKDHLSTEKSEIAESISDCSTSDSNSLSNDCSRSLFAPQKSFNCDKSYERFSDKYHISSVCSSDCSGSVYEAVPYEAEELLNASELDPLVEKSNKRVLKTGDCRNSSGGTLPRVSPNNEAMPPSNGNNSISDHLFSMCCTLSPNEQNKKKVFRSDKISSSDSSTSFDSESLKADGEVDQDNEIEENTTFGENSKLINSARKSRRSSHARISSKHPKFKRMSIVSTGRKSLSQCRLSVAEAKHGNISKPGLFASAKKHLFKSTKMSVSQPAKDGIVGRESNLQSMAVRDIGAKSKLKYSQAPVMKRNSGCMNKAAIVSSKEINKNIVKDNSSKHLKEATALNPSRSRIQQLQKLFSPKPEVKRTSVGKLKKWKVEEGSALHLKGTPSKKCSTIMQCFSPRRSSDQNQLPAKSKKLPLRHPIGKNSTDSQDRKNSHQLEAPIKVSDLMARRGLFQKFQAHVSPSPKAKSKLNLDLTKQSKEMQISSKNNSSKNFDKKQVQNGSSMVSNESPNQSPSVKLKPMFLTKKLQDAANSLVDIENNALGYQVLKDTTVPHTLSTVCIPFVDMQSDTESDVCLVGDNSLGCKQLDNLSLNGKKFDLPAPSYNKPVVFKKPALPTKYLFAKVPSFENYDISDIRSDDESDEESMPKKRVPEWAQGNQLMALLINFHYNPINIEALFGQIHPPNLNEMFKEKKPRFDKRTSSANWEHPFDLKSYVI